MPTPRPILDLHQPSQPPRPPRFDTLDLVVLPLILVLLGLALLPLTARFFPRIETSKSDQAAAHMISLARTLQTFHTDTGRYPSPTEGLDALLFPPPALSSTSWHGPYLDTSPLDPWGVPYEYTLDPALHPHLRSAGQDGTFNTPDDITR
jgi:general secretion pathway protein G